jgi:hypothetical protein
MMTIKITRKGENPDKTGMPLSFDRDRTVNIVENVTRKISEPLVNLSIRERFNDAQFLDVYARNYVKKCWMLICDLKLCAR